MKALLTLIFCLFCLNTFAAPDFSPLQREAVRFLIEDGGGRVRGSEFVAHLRMSHLLTKKELKRFPEVIPHKGYQYVQITLKNRAHDLVIVVIDPDGKAVNALYLDFRKDY